MKKISNRLEAVRKGRGLTQAQMADLLGVARNYVYLIESGRKPLTESIAHRLDEIDKQELDNPPPDPPAAVREPPAPYACQYPADCDLPAALSKLDNRLGDLEGSITHMEAQMQTLLVLLGEPLRNRNRNAG